MSGEVEDVLPPGPKNRLGRVLVGSDSQDAPHMVDYNWRIRKSPRKIRELWNLWMEQPGVEGKIETGKARESGPESGIRQQSRRWRREKVALDRIVEGGNHPDAAKAPTGGSDVLFEHRIDISAQAQVGKPDDSRVDAAARLSPRRFLADGGNSPCFSDRAQVIRPFGAIPVAALNENGCLDVVAAVEISKQIIEEVAVAGDLPEVMVGIDDRQRGIDDLLAQPRQPPSVDGRRAPVRAHRRRLPSSDRRAALSARRIALDIGLHAHELGAFDPPFSIDHLVRLMLVPEAVQGFVRRTLGPKHTVFLRPDGAGRGCRENLDFGHERMVDARGRADRFDGKCRDRVRAAVDAVLAREYPIREIHVHYRIGRPE